MRIRLIQSRNSVYSPCEVKDRGFFFIVMFKCIRYYMPQISKLCTKYIYTHCEISFVPRSHLSFQGSSLQVYYHGISLYKYKFKEVCTLFCILFFYHITTCPGNLSLLIPLSLQLHNTPSWGCTTVYPLWLIAKVISTFFIIKMPHQILLNMSSSYMGKRIQKKIPTRGIAR